MEAGPLCYQSVDGLAAPCVRPGLRSHPLVPASQRALHDVLTSLTLMLASTNLLRVAGIHVSALASISVQT